MPTIVKNIAEGAERGAAAETAKQEFHNFSLGLANFKLNLLEDKILSETGFTHLELSLGSDVFAYSSLQSPDSLIHLALRRKYLSILCKDFSEPMSRGPGGAMYNPQTFTQKMA